MIWVPLITLTGEKCTEKLHANTYPHTHPYKSTPIPTHNPYTCALSPPPPLPPTPLSPHTHPHVCDAAPFCLCMPLRLGREGTAEGDAAPSCSCCCCCCCDCMEGRARLGERGVVALPVCIVQGVVCWVQVCGGFCSGSCTF